MRVFTGHYVQFLSSTIDNEVNKISIEIIYITKFFVMREKK